MITIRTSDGQKIIAPSFHEAKKAAGHSQAAVTCDGCQIVFINKVLTYEKGCPEAWRDWERECKFCGNMFRPAERNQACCDAECQRDYES